MKTGTASALSILAQRPHDQDAWEVLENLLGDRLRELSARCCADRAAAEDAVQEALILARRDAWQFRPSPGTDPDAAAASWLAGIVVHCARRQTRAAVRRAARHRRAGARSESQAAVDALERTETAGIVRAAVAGLPPATARAVALRYFADLDYGAIARATGTTEATARQRVSRGLKTLRGRLRRIGAALGLVALIRHLRAAEPPAPAAAIPPPLFRPEIITMPRLLAAAGCAAAGLALWVGLSLLSPRHAVAAEPPPPAENEEVVVEPVEPVPAGKEVTALVASNRAFALDLYRRVAAGEQGDVVLGPHSISQALALAEAGAANQTKAEMDAVLGWRGLEDRLHPAWQALTRGLAQVQGYELALANRLFLQRGSPFKPDWVTLCKENHDAAPEACDFKADPEHERQRINSWVARQTRTRIPELIAKGLIQSDTRGVLVNACWFKGDFAHKFDAAATRTDTDFHAPDEVVPCAMMRQLGTFGHHADERVDVVRLPYGPRRGAPAGYLTLVVPKAVDGLAAVEADLDAESLDAWTLGLAGKRVDLSLPRFTSRTPVLLKGTLLALGMRLAFSDRADFSAMCSEPLLIDEVVHEAWVRTDEAGSEAAAATAVLMAPTGMPAKPEVAVTADRPFLWFITDHETGALLFLGRVVKPEDPGPAKED